ncbi:DUF6456 domain-containing protein [Actibacterium sp. XHP0104]|uniref:DUF6456 domain-containing protein n=1 Tax=Actibacterium sp. XHP0104 TaxID=2984335 RepID=UPI0021E78D73|nr:DUF6456 domain-containing protein [Actibacterium sp. XHP0104]MCV2881033.1 DUF6456 domain-containing protein [Actibacterium sp. XHP0104]
MQALPDWVPEKVACYLAHTVAGRSIRALARERGCHASTVMRSVRQLEARRDDPLVDGALQGLGQSLAENSTRKDYSQMTALMRNAAQPADEVTINREARRILRRLGETGAFMAIAADLERAVVLKENKSGETTRIAVVSRGVAEAFALKDWITCRSTGRVMTYAITQAGRMALKRLLAVERGEADGFAEAASPFAEQHRDWGQRAVMGEGGVTQQRYNIAESPLAGLARRKDKSGQPFLTPDLVAAGERLREDFELAQMGPRVTQNWDKFLTGTDRGGFSGHGPAEGPRGARERVAAALRDLGPGLGDVALRCCCFLEGMEAAEKRMGWSARSGKIVLRIALQRLRRHYDEQARLPGANMIG